MRTRVLFAAVAAASLLALTLPAEAQWNVERRSGNVVAMAAGIDGQIHVGVSCQGSNHVVAVTLPGSATFHSGDMEVQWDDGSTEQYALQDQNDTLSGSSTSPRVRALIEKLRRRNTARLRVTKGQNERVTDRISLAGVVPRDRRPALQLVDECVVQSPVGTHRRSNQATPDQPIDCQVLRQLPLSVQH